MNFWKIADLFHRLMTETLGNDRYAAGGSDMGQASELPRRVNCLGA
jgi:hypothetical protein